MSQITDLSLYYQYKILLDKLFLIDFSKTAISWYESYLEERYFTVEVVNRVSKLANIWCGVPQGSILGLLLWYEPRSGMRLVLICRWFMLALSTSECHWNKKNSWPKTSVISAIGLYTMNYVYNLERTKRNRFYLALNVKN